MKDRTEMTTAPKHRFAIRCHGKRFKFGFYLKSGFPGEIYDWGIADTIEECMKHLERAFGAKV